MTLRLSAALSALLVAAAPLAACGDDGPGTPTADTSPDTTPDSDQPDAEDPDATDPDASEPDATEPDTSLPDATEPDASDPDTGPDADPDTSEPDADPDTGPIDPPGDPMATERWGARIWGDVRGLSLIDGELWVGTLATFDPYVEDLMHTALLRLDVATGEVAVYDDELPLIDVNFPIEGTIPSPTAQVVADGDTRIVVGMTGLIIKDGESFELLTLPGGASPTHLAVDRGGDRAHLWVSTSQGLVLLDADTYEVKQELGADELGSDEVGALAVDPADGAVFVALYSTAESWTKVVRYIDGQVLELVPGEDDVPEGIVGDIVWSDTLGAAVVALGSWSKASGGVVTWDGETVTHLMSEGVLGAAATGKATAFGAQRLALDETDGVLLVGGTLKTSINAGASGGGLVWVELATGKMYGLDNQGGLPGTHVGALAWEADTNRTYATLYEQCSEFKLRAQGVYALSFRGDGSLRIERPILSGVRSLGAADGRLFAGLRDDNAGQACNGSTIQTGLVEVMSNRAGELIPLNVTLGDALISDDAGPVAMDLTSPEHFAIGTFKDGLFVGHPEGGFTMNQAFMQLSLFTHDVAFEGKNVLWVAGSATHGDMDTPNMADLGPRGLGRLTLADDGTVTGHTRFVKVAVDDKSDVGGLPTSEVRDVLVTDEGVWVACATERLSTAGADFALGAEFLLNGEPRLGGVAFITPELEVEVIVDSENAPDPFALAIADDGALIIADRVNGLLRYADGAVTVISPTWLPQAPLAYDAYFDEEGWVLALDQGLYAQFGHETIATDAFGRAFDVLPMGDGAFAVGTAEGLTWLLRAGASVPTLLPPGDGLMPVFKVVEDEGGPKDPPPDECLPENSVCAGADADKCCPGLQCVFVGFAPNCIPE